MNALKLGKIYANFISKYATLLVNALNLRRIHLDFKGKICEIYANVEAMLCKIYAKFNGKNL